MRQVVKLVILKIISNVTHVLRGIFYKDNHVYLCVLINYNTLIILTMFVKMNAHLKQQFLISIIIDHVCWSALKNIIPTNLYVMSNVPNRLMFIQIRLMFKQIRLMFIFVMIVHLNALFVTDLELQLVVNVMRDIIYTQIHALEVVLRIITKIYNH